MVLCAACRDPLLEVALGDMDLYSIDMIEIPSDI